MNNQEQVIAITIMDRTYQIKCPPSGATELQESARYLDAEMRKINQASTSNNTERLAIVAALNIAHELKTYKNQKNAYIDVIHEQIKTLQHRIQKFLGLKEEVAV
jgi:cell division protein ZapA